MSEALTSRRIGAGDGRPFRLGFLLHLDNDSPPATAYRQAIELFWAAKQLGYDSGWVIHRHFRQGNEHCPSRWYQLDDILSFDTW